MLIKVRNRGLPSIKFLCVTLWHMSIYSRHIFTYIQQAAILLFWNIAACVFIYQNLSHQGSFKNGVVVVLILQAFSGLFEILPWQTKSILVIAVLPSLSPSLFQRQQAAFAFQAAGVAGQAAAQPHDAVAGHQGLCPTAPPTARADICGRPRLAASCFAISP